MTRNDMDRMAHLAVQTFNMGIKEKVSPDMIVVTGTISAYMTSKAIEDSYKKYLNEQLDILNQTYGTVYLPIANH